MQNRHGFPAPQRWTHLALVTAGAVSMTGALFLLLPMLQALGTPPTADLRLQEAETTQLPPPPPPEPPPEPEKEPEPEEEPPKLADEPPPPLDLAQLELALGPGAAGSWTTGDFGVKLDMAGTREDSGDSLFSLADLDQKPRAIHQPSPVLDAALRRRTPGSVHVLFVVDQDGRVADPIVHKSTDPIFEGPAVTAVKKWKFEPGQRNGKAVRFRMRVPITFPEQ